MPPLNDLRQGVIDAILNNTTSATSLSEACDKLGLALGTAREAKRNKKTYIFNRINDMDKASLTKFAQKVLDEYHSDSLSNILSSFVEENTPSFSITNLTRKKLLAEIINSNVTGQLELLDFLNRIWPLTQMPSTDYRCENAFGDINQHIVNNNDWEFDWLFYDYLGLKNDSDTYLPQLLEQIVHPEVRNPEEQEKYVSIINNHLKRDGYVLQACDELSGYSIYQVVKIGKGVKGDVKNLIFAANGFKPEIGFADSVSNVIQFLKNGEYCLFYDQPIPQTGLLWTDLVKFTKTGDTGEVIGNDRELYPRLWKSLDSEPEKLLFYTYYKSLRQTLGGNLPALIPQVYLHYDSRTIAELKGRKRIPRQRMDFLLLFSNHERIVIEIDGKQHYADSQDRDAKANPSNYAKMVAEDRKLRLAGYEIYRFGGAEFVNESSAKLLVENFFQQLFNKHKIPTT